ncbi:MAG TPA: hypothetical protein VM124_01535, partial [Candidatus Limnocylindrales bacterium]|nr:hypothetical protein [Candidatus Limnocylindrales bacterium]
MSIEAPPRIKMSPVAPDGDAALSMRGSMTEMMQTVASQGMLADGSFAMTDGIETEAGFNVIPDPTGEYMRAYFEHSADELAAFDAWTERAKLASSTLELSAVLSETGGIQTVVSGEPKLLALNARGELGKVNLIATASSEEDKVAIVERDGQAYTVRKYQNGDKTDYSALSIENGSIRGVGRTDVQLDMTESEGLAAVKLTALDNHLPITLEVVPTFNATQHQHIQSPRLRGVFKGMRRRQNNSPESPEFDLEAMDGAITNFLSQQEASERADRDTESREQGRLNMERIEKEAVSIEHLSATHPAAGNLFTPGAGIFEDPVFNQVLAHHKVDIKGSNREKTLADALKRPVVRSDIAKVLRFRLDAWCETDPARQIQNQLDAVQPLDSVYDIGSPNYVKQHYPKDSLIHHASTNKRTIANMLVPSGIKPNSYKSP